MREIALDTETTGLNPRGGDRVVEIGCVELVNHVATGRHYQVYINPDRDMPDEAFKVHGLSEEFLSEKPPFADIVEEFLEFIGDAPLVIHNAEFDLGFLNAELERLGKAAIDHARAVDTVQIARGKFPGARNSLDALCSRFQIDNTERTLHGALLDAQLLAEVYLELVGGRQPDLQLASAKSDDGAVANASAVQRPPRPHAPTPDEEQTHARFVESLADPIWRS